MHITIPTPPVITPKRISTITPHLVEHLVDHPAKISPDFFMKHILDSTGDVFPSYTTYEYPDSYTIEEALNMMTAPLSPNTYNKEIKAFQKERTENRYSHISGLGIRISELLYGKKYKGDYGIIPSFKEIVLYHEKYYQPENIIISNNNDKIIYCGKNIATQQFLGNDEITYHTIAKGNNNLTCLCFSYTSSQHHRLAFFLSELLGAYIRYMQRYQQGLYFYDGVDFLSTWQHIIVSFSAQKNIIPTRGFFEVFKKYFIENSLKTYDIYRRVIDTAHGITPLNTQNYKIRIENITYTQIANILKKVN